MQIIVSLYEEFASNGAIRLAGFLILSQMGWLAAKVERIQLRSTEGCGGGRSGPDSLQVGIQPIEQLGGVTQAWRAPRSRFRKLRHL